MSTVTKAGWVWLSLILMALLNNLFIHTLWSGIGLLICIIVGFLYMILTKEKL